MTPDASTVKMPAVRLPERCPIPLPSEFSATGSGLHRLWSRCFGTVRPKRESWTAMIRRCERGRQ